MEIHEMKDDGRYGITIKANGSVWKKIAAAAKKNCVSVNKFMIDCARIGWKNADIDELSGDTFEDLKAEHPMLEGYLSALSRYSVCHRNREIHECYSADGTSNN
jgi:hypothetical protein